MRNFKKFLALVLAMLMVSACAISVSAVAFDDQAAINASGHKDAVKLLTSLGVISGRGDGTFDPAGTLTREEAAVIFAKLKTGDAGRKTDWVAATCNFADVEDEWSFAYINAVSQRGIMEGDGVNFNPKDTLTIEQALTAAVKAFAGGKAAVAKLDELGTPAYWATNWIAVAEEKGLTAGLSVIDYSCACSRAQMAQIGYNLFYNAASAISSGFNLTKETGTVKSVSGSVVTLTVPGVGGSSKELLVDLTAFETAMSAANISGKAADYLNAEVTISYSGDVIYGLSASRAYSFTYADGVLKNVMDGSNVTKYITLDDVKYAVTDAEANTIIGASTKIDNIVIKEYNNKGELVDFNAAPITVCKAFPKYYTAVAFDTDNDGDYEVINLKAFEIGTFAKKDNIKKADTVANTADIARVEVKDLAGNVAFDNNIEAYWNNPTDKKAYAYALYGEEIAFDETPVLYKVTLNKGTNVYDIEIMEVAEKISGTMDGIASNYINVDGTHYAFAPTATKPDTWTLGQQITFYAIGNEFVKVTKASNSSADILVDNVVVVDGKAVITGLKASDGYKKVDFVVDGYTETAKKSILVKKGAFAINDDSVSGDEKYGVVILADKADGNAIVTFKEGYVYSFVISSDGLAYVVKTSETDFDTTKKTYPLTNGSSFLKVDGSYVYTGAKKDEMSAQKFVKNVSVVTRTDNSTANKENKKDGRYNAYGNYAFTAAATLDVTASVTSYYEPDADGKVKLVYITSSTGVGTEANNFEEGAKLVQIISDAIEETYDYSTYNAIDLLTGAKITVKGNGAAKSHYYVVKGDTIAFKADTNGVNDQEWVAYNSTIRVEFKKSIVGHIKAVPTVLFKGPANTDTWVAIKPDPDAKEYGIDKVIIYNLADDGETIALNSAGTAAATTEIAKSALNTGLAASEDVKKINYRDISPIMAYCVADKLIVIGTPVGTTVNFS